MFFCFLSNFISLVTDPLFQVLTLFMFAAIVEISAQKKNRTFLSLARFDAFIQWTNFSLV